MMNCAKPFFNSGVLRNSKLATGAMSGMNQFRNNSELAVSYNSLLVTTPKPYVHVVELNRPKKRNAMNHEMWMEIRKCFNQLSEDPNCRAIVLSSVGSVFCSGIDVQSFAEIGSKYSEVEDIARRCKIVYNTITAYQASLTSIEKCVKPVICAIHGACVGAGVDMITAADIRYCSQEAWFQVKEVDIGLAPDVGTLQRLPKVIGSASLARELVFTARKMSSAEAKECGLVNRIFDTKEKLVEASVDVAAEIAGKSPVAVQTAKKSLIYSQDRTIEEGLSHIALMNQSMLQSEDVMNAVMGSVSKGSDPIQFSKL